MELSEFVGPAFIALVIVGMYWVYGLRNLFLKKLFSEEVFERALLFVMAAERLYENNSEKLNWVLDMLSKRYPDLDPEEIRAYIEAAVYELKKTLEGIVVDVLDE